MFSYLNVFKCCEYAHLPDVLYSLSNVKIIFPTTFQQASFLSHKDEPKSSTSSFFCKICFYLNPYDISLSYFVISGLL